MADPSEPPSMDTRDPLGLLSVHTVAAPETSLETLDLGVTPPGSPPSPGDGPLTLPPRYRWLARLGRGGMGEVHRVHDQELDRDVALKVLYGLRALAPEGRTLFLREARLTAGLQHPGIIPVYDLGSLPDGRTWYTMREVQGETLAAGWRTPPEAAPELRRRVRTLARICEAVGYAHDHAGAVHRDLKPDNVMRGRFGEVLVLDWGLALLASDPDENGRISGTPAYMAPEQARSERARICPATDVWALGGMLVAAITGSPPHRAPDLRALLHLLRQDPAPPTCPSPDPDVQSLWRVVQHALQPTPADRPPSATTLGTAIARWLDGSERRADALDHVERADAADLRARVLRSRARSHTDRATTGLAALPESATEADRRPHWDLEDDARALLDQARDTEDEATHLLRAALVRVPGLPEAMDRLADRFRTAHAEAEALGDRRGARRLLTDLRAHDRGQHAAYVRGGGHLTLHTTPVPARVVARPLVQRGRRLVPGDPVDLGPTPLEAVPLSHGSWQLVLHAPGRATGHLPIVIRRGEHVVAGGPHPVPLPRADRLGPHDLYIPPGSFIAGGSEPIVDRPLARCHRVARPLVARRFPFTLRETLAWFERLHTEGQHDRALQFCPRAQQSTPGATDGATMGLAAVGTATLLPDQDGDVWDPAWPAIMVTWFGATAICADLARWSGLPWRLPGELEWEWLARGADGRVLPWGSEHVDPAWCRHRLTGPVPLPAPVDSHPIDEGPSGVRGLAGNVMEWCLEDYPDTTPADTQGQLQVAPCAPDTAGRLKNVRGGAYSFGSYSMRSTIRRVHTARNRFFDVGFRPVRPLVPDDL